MAYLRVFVFSILFLVVALLGNKGLHFSLILACLFYVLSFLTYTSRAMMANLLAFSFSVAIVCLTQAIAIIFASIVLLLSIIIAIKRKIELGPFLLQSFILLALYFIIFS